LSGVTAIAAGGYHTLALKNDGSVVAWGDNDYGQVTGTQATDGPSATASPVTLNGQILSEVRAIAGGEFHTVALKNDGSVVAWGNNYSGQTTVPVAARSGVTAIAAGFGYTVALKENGTVVAWGDNSSGQTTVPVAAQSGVTAIAARGFHTVAVKDDGTVVAWGTSYGQVTNQVLNGVTAIAAGGREYGGHTVALRDDGTVVAWGANNYGQVTGTPTTNDSTTASPVTLGGQVLSGVTAIAAGLGHTLALIGGVPLLPALNARPNGGELILSWPTNAVGFTLQSTPSLTPPVVWFDLTNVPAVGGAQFTVTNTHSGGAQFYRLRGI